MCAAIRESIRAEADIFAFAVAAAGERAERERVGERPEQGEHARAYRDHRRHPSGEGDIRQIQVYHLRHSSGRGVCEKREEEPGRGSAHREYRRLGEYVGGGVFCGHPRKAEDVEFPPSGVCRDDDEIEEPERGDGIYIIAENTERMPSVSILSASSKG